VVVTLSGENSFAIKNALKEQVNSMVKNQSELAVEQIDCTEVELDRLGSAFNNLNLLSSEKLLILRQPSQNPAIAAALPDLIDNKPDTTQVLIVEPNIDKRSSLYKYLKYSTDFKQMNDLDKSGLVDWLIDFSVSHQAKLSRLDAEYLVSRVGQNQERLANEIKKLAAFSPVIDRSTINQLTEASLSSSIFELIEAAFSGNKSQALKLYEEQRLMHVEPNQIIAMIAWQLHIFLLIKVAPAKRPDDLAREAAIKPYVINKSWATAKRLAYPKLYGMVDQLLQIDILSKTKSINLDDHLCHFILSI
jgi:DNA polymerase-3 subunit delta